MMLYCRYFSQPDNMVEKAHHDAIFSRIVNDSTTFHFWNGITSTLVPESNSLVERILNRYCLHCLDVLQSQQSEVPAQIFTLVQSTYTEEIFQQVLRMAMVYCSIFTETLWQEKYQEHCVYIFFSPRLVQCWSYKQAQACGLDQLFYQLSIANLSTGNTECNNQRYLELRVLISSVPIYFCT